MTGAAPVAGDKRVKEWKTVLKMTREACFLVLWKTADSLHGERSQRRHEPSPEVLASAR